MPVRRDGCDVYRLPLCLLTRKPVSFTGEDAQTADYPFTESNLEIRKDLQYTCTTANLWTTTN